MDLENFFRISKSTKNAKWRKNFGIYLAFQAQINSEHEQNEGGMSQMEIIQQKKS